MLLLNLKTEDYPRIMRHCRIHRIEAVMEMGILDGRGRMGWNTIVPAMAAFYSTQEWDCQQCASSAVAMRTHFSILVNFSSNFPTQIRASFTRLGA